MGRKESKKKKIDCRKLKDMEREMAYYFELSEIESHRRTVMSKSRL